MGKLRNLNWILALMLTGCAISLPRALDEVRPGMDKDRVLETAGNPNQSFRENGQDHWIYQYFDHDKEWKRFLTFDDGKVIRITKPIAKEDWVKDLEHSSTMEEYEQHARAHQKKAGNFQPIGDTPKGK